MKLQKLITGLIIGFLLPIASVAQTYTYTADGVTYNLSTKATTSGTEYVATIESINPDVTELVIRKSITYEGTTYTMGKLSSGSKFSDSKATTVKWDGAWTEPDLTGAQFYNFKNIEKYEVANVNTEISGGKGRLEAGEDGVLYVYHSAGEIHLLAYPCNKKATSYTVRPMTQIIMGSAFRNNKFLETVDLNPQVKIIRNEAFAGTSSLTALNAFPNTSYENKSYDDKENTKVNENQYFQTIGGVLFQKDTRKGNNGFDVNFPSDKTFHRTLVVYPAGLPATTYNIPDETKVLGRSCFYGAKNLTSIGFASGAAEDLIEIREYAFNHCENLTTFQIPINVEYINMKYNDPPINPVGSGVQTGSGNYSHTIGTYTYKSQPIHAGEAMGSFDYCKKLVLSIDENNPNFQVVNTYNGSTLLSNVLLSKDGTRLVRYGCTTDFPGYIIPREVEYIDSYAFCETNVAHVVLPSKLTYVSRNMFENAKNLEFITIPPMVTDIKQDVFKGCSSKFTQVFMMPETPPTLANASVFGDNSDGHITLYVKPNKTVNNNANGNVSKTINIKDRYTNSDTSENLTSDQTKIRAYYMNSKSFGTDGSRIKTDIPVTLNANGMATMCRDFAVELLSGLEAYYIPNYESSRPAGQEGGVPNEPTETLNFILTNLASTDGTAGSFIPARTGSNYGDYRGVVLKAKEGESGPYYYQISVEDFENNFNLRGKYCEQSGGTTNWKAPRTIRQSQYIIGVPVETYITVYDGDFTTFGLKGDKFQRTKADGKVPYNKAYMRLPSATIPGKVPGSEVSNDAKFTLVFRSFDEIDLNDMETTAIQDINTEAASIANAGIVYNLQGYPVGNAETLKQGNLPNGMYILNGKKYIVR